MNSGPVLLFSFLMAIPMLEGGCAAATGPSEAPYIGPQVSVSLSPETQAVQASYTEFGVASFAGIAELDNVPVGRFTVALTASIDTGWGCACAPSVLLLTSSITTAGFTVTVSLPPGTLASLVGALTVTAEATGAGYSSTSSANATVTVLPYYLLRVQCEAPAVNVSAGSEARFRVDILNMGNDNDSFDLRIDNEREVRAAGWSASLVIPAIPAVPPGGSLPVYVVVKSPPGRAAGKGAQTIELNITSVGSRARGPVQSAVLVLTASPKDRLDDPFNLTAVIVIIVAAAVAAALVWRRRKRRRIRAIDVEEVPPE
jgi:hypothetical protein